MMRFGVSPSFLLSALWLLATGCAVVAMDESSPSATMNQCSDNSDCPGGQCTDGICSAPGGEFGTMLFEVTPPADADVPGGPFLKQIPNLSLAGGGQNIELDHVARVTGVVTGPVTSVEDDCVGVQFYDDSETAFYDKAGDGSLPVRVIITPSVRLLGIAAEIYAAEAVPTLDGNNTAIGAESFPFHLNLPPGFYDIYVQTFPTQMLDVNQEHCVVPPRLYRRQEIQSGDVALSLELDEPSTLDLTVDLPVALGRPFNEWTVDILDAIDGLPLSSKVRLGEPTPLGDRLSYNTQIIYSQVLGGAMAPTDGMDSSVSELVRLVPPEGETAPTIIMERWVLDLDGDGFGTINQLTTLPTPVEVEGQVQGPGAVPNGATVTLIATEIAGLSQGITASFKRTVEAKVERPSDPPKFRVDLLPGKYLVYTVPPADSGLAATQTTWEVGTTPLIQAGKVIELEPEASVVGSALDPMAASALVGASVHAVAASSSTTGVSVRDQAVWGLLPFAPRATTAMVDAQGAFELRADPGAFDISVRPAVSSGFPWLVQPNVVVSGQGQDLGQLVLPLPIVYQGAVTVPGAADAEATSVPNALIRAYIYLNEEHGYTAEPESNKMGLSARSVLQIAETRADDEGHFKLLVPSRLH